MSFRIPNDIQARAMPRPAVACRNPDFHRRREDPMSRVYNVIDADGHILEPLDLWDNYMDPKFRDRAPRLVIDNETGKEKLSVEGQLLGSKQGMGGIGGVGARQGEVKAAEMKYNEGRPGGFDPHKRIPDMDLDGIDAAFLYPSMGLFAGAVHDPALAGGLCEKYPKIRIGFLESGGGWIAPWLDRMDRHFDDQGFNDSGLTTRPSDLFKRNCWISFEPVEGSLNVLADYVGPNKIMWATDYPHRDGFFPGAPDMVRERLKGTSPATQKGVLAGGAMGFYGLN